MITKNLMNALERLGFTYSDNKNQNKTHAYAIYGGYLVTVYESAGKKVAYFNFKFSDSEENTLKRYDMSETFSEELAEYSVTDYSLSEDGMRVFCNGSTAMFLKLIDRCVELLIENEIRGAEYCSKCGNKIGARNPKKVTDGKDNYLMCDHCALEAVEEINNRKTEAQTNEPGKNIFGIIGSVVFSLIGAFVFFVLYYLLSPKLGSGGAREIRYIFCAMGFVISMLAYFGYRIFSKKSGACPYVTIAINSLLFTALGQFFGTVFEFIAINNYPVSFLSNKHFWLIHLRDTVPAEISSNFPHYSDDFYKFFAISLLFAAVGAAIFLLTLHEKNNIPADTAEVETLHI